MRQLTKQFASTGDDQVSNTYRVDVGCTQFATVIVEGKNEEDAQKNAIASAKKLPFNHHWDDITVEEVEQLTRLDEDEEEDQK
jgi:hypothetical protein